MPTPDNTHPVVESQIDRLEAVEKELADIAREFRLYGELDLTDWAQAVAEAHLLTQRALTTIQNGG